MIHISEAGLLKKDPMGMTGYKAVKLARKEPNRGSVIWVRSDLMDRMVRVYAPKEEDSGSEVIQLQMDTIPPTNIFGVYLETGKPDEEKEYAHQKLQQRVTECKNEGQNVILMGDFNAALNDTAKPFNLAARRILEWEKTGDIRILNNKQIPTRVPYRKGDQANCLDLMMISPGLEDRTSNYKLDVDQEWSPARAEPTGQGKGSEMMYTRGKASDHMAQKATVILDLVEKGKAGNRAIINYNNREGWKLYPTVSNE